MTIQRNEAWVKTATPEEIDRANTAGELKFLMGEMAAVPAPADLIGIAASVGVSPTDLAHMTDDAVTRMIRDAVDTHPEWA